MSEDRLLSALNASESVKESEADEKFRKKNSYDRSNKTI